MQVEICVNSIQSAVNAKKGGAERVELCQNLNEGGTTPSAAAIEYCVHQLDLRTHVLVRPRPGNFVYSPEEMEVLLRDIELCRLMGAQAVVVGFLTAEGDIDVEKTRQAVEAAGEMEVTFHRAFDECRDWRRGLQDIIACGCDRILTSGQRPTAFEGRETLREMVQAAENKLVILAGSGVTPANVAQLIKESGVSEVHGSCKHQVNGISETDENQVRELLILAKNACLA